MKNIFKKILFTILFFNKIKFLNSKKIIFLGSKYGGWSFLNLKNLKNGNIISAGLGEDASFDIEIAKKYDCNIIFIDPTPRAIDHFNLLRNNLGKKKTMDYPSNSGKMPLESYNLENINSNKIFLIEKALADKNNEILKFFKPKNSNFVSHSAVIKKSNEFVEVKSINLTEVIKKYNINKINILKMDIEGSEISVLKSMIISNIFPDQICVEIEILQNFSFKNLKVFNEINDILYNNSYYFVFTRMNFPNFLYIRKDLINI